MLCKLLVPPSGDCGQYFTIDCDLLAEINNANIFGFCVLRTGHGLMMSTQDRCHLALEQEREKEY